MSHFQTSDGLSLYYADHPTANDSGPVVLCLAGLTRNTADFDHVMPHLSGCRVIAMDYRGRGQSDFDPDHANYNVMREAQDVIELLDHLGLEQVTILGTSRGGLLAMMLAALHKGRLSGVILNDIGPFVSPTGIARIMEYVGKQPNSKTLGEAAFALKVMMEPEFPDVSIERWRHFAAVQHVEIEDGLALSYDAKLRDALIEQAEAGKAVPDLWPLFMALAGLPAGVIRGANSDILPAETVTEMAERLPGLVVGVVPNRGHAPFLDEPESLAVIRQVLEATT